MAGGTLQYHYTPLHQNIMCSATAIAALPATVDALGARRAMITCGPTILRACDVVPRVQAALGFRYVGVYAGVAPHAPVETVEEGVAMAKEVQPDIFISVGGGSTHDTTKAIATLLAEGGDLRDYAIRFEPPDRVLGLCRKFCVGGREGAVAPVGGEIKRPGSRTVRPQCGPRLRPPPSAVVS